MTIIYTVEKGKKGVLIAVNKFIKSKFNNISENFEILSVSVFIFIKYLLSILFYAMFHILAV